jgi:predicted nucleotidyltransferase component of viral defense system
MNRGYPRDPAASVRRRLLNLARERGEDFQRVLIRYTSERLLYRLSCSEYRDSFVLKGALLFAVWFSEPYRPTKDLDLLGRGPSEVGPLVEAFRALCSTPVEADGLTFLPESVVGGAIRDEMEYGGIRINLLALLGNARIPLQVDVGFGDAVTPAPSEVDFPTLLDLPGPRLRVYPRETVVAEKLEALVRLDLDNSRMKDFYDLWVLSRRFAFEGAVVVQAVRATFQRRGTALPADTPVALTTTFSDSSAKQTQWQAFIRRGASAADVPPLAEIITGLRAFLLPPLEALQGARPFANTWSPGGHWSPTASVVDPTP